MCVSWRRWLWLRPAATTTAAAGNRPMRIRSRRSPSIATRSPARSRTAVPIRMAMTISNHVELGFRRRRHLGRAEPGAHLQRRGHVRCGADGDRRRRRHQQRDPAGDGHHSPVERNPTAALRLHLQRRRLHVHRQQRRLRPARIASCAWDFGDAATSTEADPGAPYAGVTELTDFDVTLTVTDDDGGTGTVTKTVAVAPPAQTTCDDGLGNSRVRPDPDQRRDGRRRGHLPAAAARLTATP